MYKVFIFQFIIYISFTQMLFPVQFNCIQNDRDFFNSSFESLNAQTHMQSIRPLKVRHQGHMVGRVHNRRNGRVLTQLRLAGRRHRLGAAQRVRLVEDVVDALGEADRVVGERNRLVGGAHVEGLLQVEVGQRFGGVCEE